MRYWSTACALTVAGALLWPSPVLTVQPVRAIDRPAGPGAKVRLPATAANIGESLAALAKSANLRIGFEAAIEDDELHEQRGSFERGLTGLTVAEALDQIVAGDDRYSWVWRERHGIVHVRPTAAIRDANHFLNRRVARFTLDAAIPLDATFAVHRIYRPDCEVRHVIHSARRAGFLAGLPPAHSKPVTLSLTNTTALDVMDAVISAHGELHWNLSYKVPAEAPLPRPRLYDYAIFGFNDQPGIGGWWRMCVGDELRFPE